MSGKPISQQARSLVAEAISDQGPQWLNLACMVGDGFENLWLTPALRAVDKALDTDREES